MTKALQNVTYLTPASQPTASQMSNPGSLQRGFRELAKRHFSFGE